MADGIFIDVSGFEKLKGKITGLRDNIGKTVDSVLDGGIKAIEGKAKELAPVNFGDLRAAINADDTKFLEKRITVRPFYAAFQEFGSGAYAAAYVSTLPPTWQEYAATFKGQTGGGTFDEMVRNIFEWIKKKGYRLDPEQAEQGDTFVRGKLKKPKKPKKQTIEEGQQVLAYLTARRILRDGNKPRPFLFPAYDINIPIIEKDLGIAIKSLLK